MGSNDDESLDVEIPLMFLILLLLYPTSPALSDVAKLKNAPVAKVIVVAVAAFVIVENVRYIHMKVVVRLEEDGTGKVKAAADFVDEQPVFVSSCPKKASSSETEQELVPYRIPSFSQRRSQLFTGSATTLNGGEGKGPADLGNFAHYSKLPAADNAVVLLTLTRSERLRPSSSGDYHNCTTGKYSLSTEPPETLPDTILPLVLGEYIRKSCCHTNYQLQFSNLGILFNANRSLPL